MKKKYKLELLWLIIVICVVAFFSISFKNAFLVQLGYVGELASVAIMSISMGFLCSFSRWIERWIQAENRKKK